MNFNINDVPDFIYDDDEILLEICDKLLNMYNLVYNELQRRKLQELHSFVMGRYGEYQ